MLNSQRVTVVKFTLFLFAIAIAAYMAIKTPILPLAETDSAVTASAPENAIGVEQNLSSRESRAKTNGQDARPTSNCVIVYYFHMTARCGPCIRMEDWTKEAVLSGFAGATKAGQLAWRAIDVEKSENDHFIDDYRLTDMSVVVAEIKGGKRVRHKTLEETWSLLDDKAAFLRYVRNQVRPYLARG